MTNDMPVAVIGLGAMGGRIARRLVDAGHDVTGFDPSAGARDAVRRAGVRTESTASKALADAEAVILSLSAPADVAESATGHGQAIRTGATVVDLSTIDPATARSVAATLSAHGVGYLDAPVLGRPEQCGAWTLPTGGDFAALERLRPLLEGSIAKSVVHAGDVGAGSTVKLLNNLMFGAINAATSEILTTCRAAGVDPERFVDILIESNSAAVSNLFRELAPKLLKEDFTPTFALRLLHKDNRLALALGVRLGCPAFLATATQQVNGLALAAGYGDEDTGSVIKLYQQLSAADPEHVAGTDEAPTVSAEMRR